MSAVLTPTAAPSCSTSPITIAPLGDVLGAEVSYQRWGKRGAPGLLFVHGNGAHAHWWDFIAPYFAEHYNVAALTFSGMGDSEWREMPSVQRTKC